MKTIHNKKLSEICNECGKSVKVGSGLYVNRVIDFNNKNYRKQMRKPYFKGDFICIECDNEIRKYDTVLNLI